MSSTFFGIELGRRALSANQLALNVVGQNTSNVNTPGYSRQVVQFEETDPYTVPNIETGKPNPIGSGVTVTAINRIRDQFLDGRVYSANGDQASIDTMKDIVGRVEQAYNEPTTSGLSQLMTNFFSSFSDLHTSPESGAIRSTVRNKAETLVEGFHALDTMYAQMGPETTSRINSTVNDVNAIAGQIASLNQQISQSVVSGDQPNDLMDQRGALLDKLSSMVDIKVSFMANSTTGSADGQVSVLVGGYALVQGAESSQLPATFTTTNGVNSLVTADNNTIPISGGTLNGLIESTKLLSGYKADLDKLANALVTSVNSIHEQGYGLDGANNHDFFAAAAPGQTITAGTISISADVKNDVNAIAAAVPIAPAPTPPALPYAAGNGENASAISKLLQSNNAALGGFSPGEYYSAKVAALGSDSSTLKSQSSSQSKVVTMLTNMQSSISGVSLDEEMTKMMQYQRSYQAAARIVNVMDDVLDRLINNMGV